MQYMTVKDVMAKYQVTKQAVYKWMKQGMPSHKFGTIRRFVETEVDVWMEERRK